MIKLNHGDRFTTSHKRSYHKSLHYTRSVFRVPETVNRLPNFKVIPVFKIQSRGLEILRDLRIRRPIGYWTGPLLSRYLEPITYIYMIYTWSNWKQRRPNQVTHTILDPNQRRVSRNALSTDNTEISAFEIGQLWPLLHGLTLTPAWISNHMPSKLWDEITYLFPNLKGCSVEDWEWISNFIPYFIMGVITYPCWD